MLPHPISQGRLPIDTLSGLRLFHLSQLNRGRDSRWRP